MATSTTSESTLLSSKTSAKVPSVLVVGVETFPKARDKVIPPNLAVEGIMPHISLVPKGVAVPFVGHIVVPCEVVSFIREVILVEDFGDIGLAKLLPGEVRFEGALVAKLVDKVDSIILVVEGVVFGVLVLVDGVVEAFGGMALFVCPLDSEAIALGEFCGVLVGPGDLVEFIGGFEGCAHVAELAFFVCFVDKAGVVFDKAVRSVEAHISLVTLDCLVAVAVLVVCNLDVLVQASVVGPILVAAGNGFTSSTFGST